MTSYLDCWMTVAATLFSQALAGEPSLTETLPKPLTATFGFECVLSGDEEGRFTVLLEEGIVQTPLLGEGMDQKAAWGELLREVADAAAGDMLPKAGRRCSAGGWQEVAGDKPDLTSLSAGVGRRLLGSSRSR